MAEKFPEKLWEGLRAFAKCRLEACEGASKGRLCNLFNAPRGYSLMSAPDFLLPEEIGAGLVTRVLGRSVTYCPEVQSTQDYAKKMAAEGAVEGTVVVAERQSEGRGRMGRAWSSPGEASISRLF